MAIYSQPYMTLVDNFAQRPLLNASIGVAANLNWELTGTNAADAGSTFNAGAGVNLATAGADNDQIIVVPHQDTNQAWHGVANVFDTDQPMVFRWRFRTVASVATMTICFGVRPLATLQGGANALAVTTDADALLFRAATATDTVFNVITAIGNTDTVTALGTTPADATVAASTTYDFSFELNLDRTGVVKLNGIPMATTAALTANTILGVPFFGIQANSAAAKNIRLLQMSCAIVPKT